MGGCTSVEESQIYDNEGKPIVTTRRCIVLLSPPSFETSKFIDGFPTSLKYKYISVGKLIRDEINKKTHYSKIIMDNLAKYKKINDKILEVLLKNTALQGNFIIHFCPKDNDDLDIWRKFLNQVIVDMVIILKTQANHDAKQQKTIYNEKMKSFDRDIRNVKDLFNQEQIHELKYDSRIYEKIVNVLHAAQQKRQG